MANNFHELATRGMLAASLAASVIATGCSGKAAPNAQAGGPGGMPVKVVEARAVPVNDASEYVATLKSRDSAVIMPQVEGQITQIFVHSGERVEAGSPMIEIDLGEETV
jgi:multidrug efflux pump subunit AcrA (membrane-fusion protein)